MLQRSLTLALLCCAFGAAPALALAQAAVAASAPAARVEQEAPPTRGEPAVRRSVIEDDNARVEELRVRGAVQSIKVQPKGPVKAEYEVLPIDAGRDSSEGPSSAKGGAGRRVWRVLTF
ncbi:MULTISPECIES: hypothetical protein [unclassified Methylibium]|jgi:hypothetical protein|uniref:hypothetical protein n=1 Tax=unclassified Methylibium TaxID=2633235 RepID=UPI0006F5BBDE|nr:hypothetical protein [Methylibium sp. Root1272]KQW66794.1 hypothetical protein ASC67_12675 [Methylibium sp. Root1272]